MEEKVKNRNRILLWFDKMDNKAEAKGPKYKTLWQFVKFCGVSVIVAIVQVATLNLMYILMKGWTTPLPDFLQAIFTDSIVGEGHSNWGYVFPFFMSNFLANTLGYFLNKSRTFKSDAPIWHYILYTVILMLLILFSTWFQGVATNWFINLGVGDLAPTIGMSVAGFLQFIVLFPLQKFVLLREKKDPTIEIKIEAPSNNVE